MVRTWSAVGKETLCKRQQTQNGSPHMLLSILLAQQLLAQQQVAKR